MQGEAFFKTLLDISLQMARTRDLQPLLEYAMSAALELVGAECGHLILLNGDGTLDYRVSLRRDGRPVADPERQVSQSILQWVLTQHQPLVLMNAVDDSAFNLSASVTSLGLRSVMCVPMETQQQVGGAIYVENRSSAAVFDERDLEPLVFFATQAAIFIQNALLNENLEAQVRARTAELQASNADLEAFAYTVAHDLKNPLTWLIGHSSLLETEHGVMQPAEVVESVRMIGQCGYKMASIVDELLLLASVRQVDQVPAGPLDMAAIVSAALGRLADMRAEYGAGVAVSGADHWPVAVGHGPWVEEVWINYLSNALKYGGRPPFVELGAGGPVGGQVRFWVRDNGPGLAAEEQARLFVPFTRLAQVRAEGHGLGLSIAQRIIAKLGGQVGLDSRPGDGSTFWFTLPVWAAADQTTLA